MSCGGAKALDARYPPRPPGCPVQVFAEAPPMPTDNIGTVRSRCATDVSHEDCLRELEDQACALGADVVWGVADAPRLVADKNEWSGRAVHTK
jgi:hypothetical protein